LYDCRRSAAGVRYLHRILRIETANVLLQRYDLGLLDDLGLLGALRSAAFEPVYT